MFDTALIVIGLQRDYLADGKCPLAGIERAVERASQMIGLFRSQAMPVIHVRHVARDSAAGFLLEDTPGIEIDPRVAPEGDDMLITKNFPNAFRETTLARILHVLGARELFFCGAMSNLCVDATVRAAFDMNYRCTVVEDACAAGELAFGGNIISSSLVHGAFMAALASAYGEVVDLKTVFARLASG
ncbi:MAG: isochorismatase family protein [Betaproteobacteria bacterium]